MWVSECQLKWFNRLRDSQKSNLEPIIHGGPSIQVFFAAFVALLANVDIFLSDFSQHGMKNWSATVIGEDEISSRSSSESSGLNES